MSASIQGQEDSVAELSQNQLSFPADIINIKVEQSDYVENINIDGTECKVENVLHSGVVESVEPDSQEFGDLGLLLAQVKTNPETESTESSSADVPEGLAIGLELNVGDDHNYTPLIGVDPDTLVNFDISQCERDEENSIKCPHCRYTTKNTSHMKSHLVCHSDMRPYACNKCNFRTNRKKTLEDHTLRHSDDKPFRCTKCDFTTKTQNYLKVHQKLHNKKKEYSCPACNFRSKHWQSIRCHLMTHTEEKPIKCELCDFTTKHFASLNYHMKVHANQRDFKCTICNFNAASSSNLKQHMLVHSDLRPFSCQICSSSYKTKKALDVHMVIHSGFKRFQCDKCEKSFFQLSNFKRHQIVHDGPEELFSCEYCPTEFTLKENLKRHMKKHLDPVEYKCKLCFRTFTERVNLRRHLDTVHLRAVQIPCQYCKQIFAAGKSLKHHIEVFHPDGKVVRKRGLTSQKGKKKCLQIRKPVAYTVSKNPAGVKEPVSLAEDAQKPSSTSPDPEIRKPVVCPGGKNRGENRADSDCTASDPSTGYGGKKRFVHPVEGVQRTVIEPDLEIDPAEDLSSQERQQSSEQAYKSVPSLQKKKKAANALKGSPVKVPRNGTGSPQRKRGPLPRENSPAASTSTPLKRKPGRPPKSVEKVSSTDMKSTSPVKRKPGRPPKGSQLFSSSPSATSSCTSLKKKPGRPKQAQLHASVMSVSGKTGTKSLGVPIKRKPGRPPGKSKSPVPVKRRKMIHTGSALKGKSTQKLTVKQVGTKSPSNNEGCVTIEPAAMKRKRGRPPRKPVQKSTVTSDEGVVYFDILVDPMSSRDEKSVTGAKEEVGHESYALSPVALDASADVDIDFQDPNMSERKPEMDLHFDHMYASMPKSPPVRVESSEGSEPQAHGTGLKSVDTPMEDEHEPCAQDGDRKSFDMPLEVEPQAQDRNESVGKPSEVEPEPRAQDRDSKSVETPSEVELEPQARDGDESVGKASEVEPETRAQDGDSKPAETPSGVEPEPQVVQQINETVCNPSKVEPQAQHIDESVEHLSEVEPEPRQVQERDETVDTPSEDELQPQALVTDESIDTPSEVEPEPQAVVMDKSGMVEAVDTPSEVEPEPHASGMDESVDTPPVEPEPHASGMDESVDTPSEVEPEPRASGMDESVNTPPVEPEPHASGMDESVDTPSEVEPEPHASGMNESVDTPSEVEPEPHASGMVESVDTPPVEPEPHASGMDESVDTPSEVEPEPRASGMDKSVNTPPVEPEPHASGMDESVDTPSEVEPEPHASGMNESVDTPSEVEPEPHASGMDESVDTPSEVEPEPPASGMDESADTPSVEPEPHASGMDESVDTPSEVEPEPRASGMDESVDTPSEVEPEPHASGMVEAVDTPSEVEPEPHASGMVESVDTPSEVEPEPHASGMVESVDTPSEVEPEPHISGMDELVDTPSEVEPEPHASGMEESLDTPSEVELEPPASGMDESADTPSVEPEPRALGMDESVDRPSEVEREPQAIGRDLKMVNTPSEVEPDPGGSAGFNPCDSILPVADSNENSTKTCCPEGQTCATSPTSNVSSATDVLHEGSPVPKIEVFEISSADVVSDLGTTCKSNGLFSSLSPESHVSNVAVSNTCMQGRTNPSTGTTASDTHEASKDMDSTTSSSLPLKSPSLHVSDSDRPLSCDDDDNEMDVMSPLMISTEDNTCSEDEITGMPGHDGLQKQGSCKGTQSDVLSYFGLQRKTDEARFSSDASSTALPTEGSSEICRNLPFSSTLKKPVDVRNIAAQRETEETGFSSDTSNVASPAASSSDICSNLASGSTVSKKRMQLDVQSIAVPDLLRKAQDRNKIQRRWWATGEEETNPSFRYRDRDKRLAPGFAKRGKRRGRLPKFPVPFGSSDSTEEDISRKSARHLKTSRKILESYETDFLKKRARGSSTESDTGEVLSEPLGMRVQSQGRTERCHAISSPESSVRKSGRVVKLSTKVRELIESQDEKHDELSFPFGFVTPRNAASDFETEHSEKIANGPKRKVGGGKTPSASEKSQQDDAQSDELVKKYADVIKPVSLELTRVDEPRGDKPLTQICKGKRDKAVASISKKEKSVKAVASASKKGKSVAKGKVSQSTVKASKKQNVSQTTVKASKKQNVSQCTVKASKKQNVSQCTVKASKKQNASQSTVKASKKQTVPSTPKIGSGKKPGKNAKLSNPPSQNVGMIDPSNLSELLKNAGTIVYVLPPGSDLSQLSQMNNSVVCVVPPNSNVALPGQQAPSTPSTAKSSAKSQKKGTGRKAVNSDKVSSESQPSPKLKKSKKTQPRESAAIAETKSKKAGKSVKTATPLNKVGAKKKGQPKKVAQGKSGTVGRDGLSSVASGDISGVHENASKDKLPKGKRGKATSKKPTTTNSALSIHTLSSPESLQTMNNEQEPGPSLALPDLDLGVEKLSEKCPPPSTPATVRKKRRRKTALEALSDSGVADMEATPMKRIRKPKKFEDCVYGDSFDMVNDSQPEDYYVNISRDKPVPAQTDILPPAPVTQSAEVKEGGKKKETVSPGNVALTESCISDDKSLPVQTVSLPPGPVLQTAVVKKRRKKKEAVSSDKLLSTESCISPDNLLPAQIVMLPPGPVLQTAGVKKRRKKKEAVSSDKLLATESCISPDKSLPTQTVLSSPVTGVQIAVVKKGRKKKESVSPGKLLSIEAGLPVNDPGSAVKKGRKRKTSLSSSDLEKGKKQKQTVSSDPLCSAATVLPANEPGVKKGRKPKAIMSVDPALPSETAALVAPGTGLKGKQPKVQRARKSFPRPKLPCRPSTSAMETLYHDIFPEGGVPVPVANDPVFAASRPKTAKKRKQGSLDPGETETDQAVRYLSQDPTLCSVQEEVYVDLVVDPLVLNSSDVPFYLSAPAEGLTGSLLTGLDITQQGLNERVGVELLEQSGIQSLQDVQSALNLDQLVERLDHDYC